ncbi:MAG: M48 family metallopeptidase [Chitinophagales bacterium]|nr:M48 family metallopeptidase [Chitinophagales bacterium]MDW8418296.1 M48 family metallopeptidase [Chitinophagales bacterium]
MMTVLFDVLPFSGKNETHTAFTIDVNDTQVPVRILFENRPNCRVSISKTGILMRISSHLTKEEQRHHIDKFLKWAKDKIHDKPQLLDTLPQRRYTNGEILRVGDTLFCISLFYREGTKSTARIFRNNIVLQLARGLSPEAHDNAASYLVAKCLAKYFQPIISQRIHELNERYFRQKIHSVRLKYATSYWGHCSHDGNIVISLRLLFAPQRVIDYVLIHELAHLIHHNHSDKFWKLVAQIMPDFQQAEQHLKEYGHKYYL